MLFRATLCAVLLGLPATVFAYKIDESCVKKGIAGDVRNAMISAFEMADSGLNHLNQNPYDQNTANLVRHLFMPGNNGQSVNDRFRMDKVRSIFRGIRQMRDEVRAGENVGVNDVIIYCDDSRWEKTDQRDLLGRPLFKDTVTGSRIVYNEQACHEPGPFFLGKVSLAVTWNAYKATKSYNAQTGDTEYREEQFPAQIQICAWFIDWIKSKEYKLGDQVTRTQLGRKIVKKAEGNKGLKQIDAFSLLDKVLLHEMTHTRAAWIGFVGNTFYEGTEDVTVPSSFFGFSLPFGLVPAYGWKLAGDLARLGQDVVGTHDWSLKAADHNADSIALFGSAAKLLDIPNPRRITDDGRLEPLT